MSYCAKHVRAYLSSLGLPDSAGDFFHERCNYLWGDGGWQIADAGITAGGVLVIPKNDYPLFMSGLPYGKDGLQLDVIRIAPPDETGEIVVGDPLCCQICGRKTATPVGMETHMRLKHGGAPNVAPILASIPTPTPTPAPVEEPKMVEFEAEVEPRPQVVRVKEDDRKKKHRK